MLRHCFVSLRFLVPLASLILLASGCVQVEQRLSLNASGGGTLVFGYTMSKEVYTELEARVRAEMGDEEGEVEMPFSFDKEKIREEFKEYESLGIALEDIRTWDDDTNKHVRLEIRFDSLAGVMKTEFFSDRVVELKRLDGDVYEYRQRGAQADQVSQETADMMRAMLAGFRATLAFDAPGEILESNADKKEGRRVEWVFDVDRDAQALVRAQSEDLWVRFSADGLTLPEYPAR